MTVTVSPAELAQRSRRHSVRITAEQAAVFLAEWLERGLVEEALPGRFQLSESGAAFAGWVGAVDLDEGAAPTSAPGEWMP